MKRRQDEISFITFFRAMAAFWVLVGHCLIWGGWQGVPFPNPKSAVDLFMVISGFLMASNALSRGITDPFNTSSERIHYWIRRFFRIAPTYYFALFLSIIFASEITTGRLVMQTFDPTVWQAGGKYDPTNVNYDPLNVFLHLTFLFGLHPRYSLSAFLPDWSLSLEMQFYAVLPFLLAAISGPKFTRNAIGFAVAGLLIGLYFNRRFDFLEPSFLFLKLHFFIAGILVFQALRTRRFSVAAAAVGVTLFESLISSQGLLSFHAAIGPLMLIAVLACGWHENTTHSRQWVTTLMASKFFRFGSDVSYGVYLLHGFFIAAAGILISSSPLLGNLGSYERVAFIFIFVCFGSYGSGYLAHKLIEVPGIKVGKAVIRYVKIRSEAVAAENVR